MDYGKREDGTPKGKGFFGLLPYNAPGAKPGTVASELSFDTEVDGKKIFGPTIVPTLSHDELHHLLSGKEPTKAIYDKATDHALQRIQAGKSPFAQDGEQVPPPKPDQEEFEAGFKGQQAR